MVGQVWLIRHGETEWSRSGRHTGRSEVPLTARGEQQARHIGALLRDRSFAAVLVSPRVRARRTCELAGFAAQAQVQEDLREWDYGEYEGLTAAQIRAQRPQWDVFRDGCPGGESPAQVCARVDALLERVRALQGSVALFGHGHLLRAVAVRWIGLPLQHGRNLGLSAGALSLLGYEHDNVHEPAIELWNAAANGLFDLQPRDSHN